MDMCVCKSIMALPHLGEEGPEHQDTSLLLSWLEKIYPIKTFLQIWLSSTLHHFELKVPNIK